MRPGTKLLGRCEHAVLVAVPERLAVENERRHPDPQSLRRYQTHAPLRGPMPLSRHVPQDDKDPGPAVGALLRQREVPPRPQQRLLYQILRIMFAGRITTRRQMQPSPLGPDVSPKRFPQFLHSLLVSRYLDGMTRIGGFIPKNEELCLRGVRGSQPRRGRLQHGTDATAENQIESVNSFSTPNRIQGPAADGGFTLRWG